MTAVLAFQLLIAGVSVGGIYALIALAIVIPFKSSGVLNFGQGELVTFGAYAALVITQLALPYWLTVALVLAIGALGGVLLERTMIRPIVKTPEFTLVIATFAIGLLIKTAIRLHWGDTPYSVEGPFGYEPVMLAGLPMNPTSLWILACTATVSFGLAAFFRYSKLGKAMRAVSIHAEAARLMGIRAETVYRSAWAVSTAIGAFAGLLVAPVVGVNPEVGHVILKALVAAVIGGFTSLGGAVIGGLVVGVVEVFSGALFGSTLKNLVPFLILMGLLMWRPYGLFGAAAVKRV